MMELFNLPKLFAKGFVVQCTIVMGTYSPRLHAASSAPLRVIDGRSAPYAASSSVGGGARTVLSMLSVRRLLMCICTLPCTNDWLCPPTIVPAMPIIMLLIVDSIEKLLVFVIFEELILAPSNSPWVEFCTRLSVDSAISDAACSRAAIVDVGADDK